MYCQNLFCSMYYYFDCVCIWFTDKHVNTYYIRIAFAVYIVVVLGASIIGKEG